MPLIEMPNGEKFEVDEKALEFLSDNKGNRGEGE